MEALSLLEKKISALVDIIQELKKEKSALIEEVANLQAKLEMIENSLLVDSGQVEELRQEKALTKSVVDDLIRSIDLLVEEKQP
jgi:DNA-binding protein H-NS